MVYRKYVKCAVSGGFATLERTHDIIWNIPLMVVRLMYQTSKLRVLHGVGASMISFPTTVITSLGHVHPFILSALKCGVSKLLFSSTLGRTTFTPLAFNQIWYIFQNYKRIFTKLHKVIWQKALTKKQVLLEYLQNPAKVVQFGSSCINFCKWLA